MNSDISRTVSTVPLDPPADPDVHALAWELQDSALGLRLRERLTETDERTVRDQVRLASTPAPPFHEEVRGRLMRGLLEEVGVRDLRVDEVGNVVGWFGPPGPAPLVVSAHLDTVFSQDQEIVIREENGVWTGPGICDDARGLAVLLAVLRALDAEGVTLSVPLLVAATVGEEGEGNLRGVRHLMGPDGAGSDARAFISIDGAGVRRVIAAGVGSWRARYTISGPGGHSWADAGRVNPIRVAARAVASLDEIDLPGATTLNIGRISGGTSINAIPESVWVEVEVRSEDETRLSETVRQVRACIRKAVEEWRPSGRGGVLAGAKPELVETVMGHRPAGQCDPESSLCRAAAAATRVVAGSAELASSSTDANLAMSLGIPAVTLGGGGESAEAHTVKEWYRNTNGPEGVLRTVLTLLTFAELEGARG